MSLKSDIKSLIEAALASEDPANRATTIDTYAEKLAKAIYDHINATKDAEARSLTQPSYM